MRKMTVLELESLRSARGGFDRETLKILGVPWPPPTGWMEEITGATKHQIQKVRKQNGTAPKKKKKKKRHKIQKLRPRVERSSNIEWLPRDEWEKQTQRFYKSQAWKEARYAVLRRDAGACSCCGARASDGVRLHVDHIKPRSKYPELQLDITNLQILCEDCNFGKSNYYNDDWRVKMQ